MPRSSEKTPGSRGPNPGPACNLRLALPLAMATALPAVLPHALSAQDATQGRALTLGFSTGIVVNDNRALDTDSLGTTFEAISRMDFDLSFATPIQTFSLAGDIGLRWIDAPAGSTLSNGLTDPNLRLEYTRESRDARLSFSAFVAQSDVSSSRLILTDLDDDGVLDDLDTLTEDGTRLRYGADVELELRRRSPFGITLAAGYNALRYSNTTAASLSDQDRFRASVGLRFDLNPSLQGRMNLELSTFEDQGTIEGRRDTYQLNTSLTQQMTNGSAAVRANATSTEEGDRYTLSAERSIELPLWQITGELGLTRSIGGDIFPIGAISLAHELPQGELSASLRRSVRSGSDDDERRVSTVSIGYSQQLTPSATFGMDFSYIDSASTGTGADTNLAVLGLSLQKTLTKDWSVDFGLQHRVTDDQTNGKARDNRLSITLRRDLSLRF